MPLHAQSIIQVVNEDAIVGAGVVTLLAQREGMVATISTLSRAAQLFAGPNREACDLVIADYASALSLLSGAWRSNFGTHCGPRVLALTTRDGEWEVRTAIEAGVDGYLLQRCDPEQLAEAARALCTGLRYVSVELASKLADSLLQDPLTAREMDVLMAMSTGASNKDIAHVLGITHGTVKSHVRAILGKVGAVARTEAVVIAAQRGLTSRRPPERAAVALNA